MTYRSIFTLGILSALLISGSRHEGYAQRRPNSQFLPYSSVGFGAGTSTYFGDLAGYGRPLKALVTLPRWNAGLMFSRQFTPRLGARASFTWARITGDDYTYAKGDPVTYSPQFIRNLHFRNDLKEFALIGTYDFIPGGRTPRDRPKLTPYALLGVALVAHNPKALTPRSEGGQPDGQAQQWVALQPLGTEGQGQPGYAKPYSLVTISVPIGIGIRYKLSEYLSLAAEVRAAPTFSDYLDDVGGPYPNPADLSTPLARDFSNRGFIDNAGSITIKEVITARGGDNRQPGIDVINGSDADFSKLQQRGGGGMRLPLRDSYLLTSFQIHYIIPAKIKCPPMR